MKSISNSSFRNTQFSCLNPKLGKIPALKLLSKVLLLSKFDVDGDDKEIFLRYALPIKVQYPYIQLRSMSKFSGTLVPNTV